MYKELIDTIDSSSHFNFADFIYGSSAKEAVFKYRYNTYYYFKIIHELKNPLANMGLVTIGSETETSIFVEYVPSDITTKMVIQINHSSDIINAINKWLHNLLNELFQDPVIRKINDDIKKIKEAADKINESDDEVFTSEEITNWVEKLEDAQTKIREEISSLKKENKKIKESLQKMVNEIDLLKTTIQTSKKGTWIKSLAFKAATWLSNPQNQTALVDNIKSIQGMIESH
jgi:uncharacterized coiled-coil DUF342 family protein